MQMIKRGNQADMFRQQHAITKYIAGHVTDAYYGKILLLNIDSQFTEMTLDRDPGSLGSNSHRFMVIAIATPRSEAITQPPIRRIGLTKKVVVAVSL